jgi:cation-dependent mannose-6-phosphate receptor
LRKFKDKRQVHSGANYKQYDDETNLQTEKEMAAESEKDKDTAVRRKSAIISFRCNNDPGASAARLSFIDVDEDECTYVFSIMSQHACAKTEPHKKGSVGPGGLFLIIALVALAVYLGGGLFYQRTVMHARGWRQLPNYSLWAGIWSFIQVCLREMRRCFFWFGARYRIWHLPPYQTANPLI